MAKSYVLLKTEKNRMLALLQSVGLNGHDFKWSKEIQGTGSSEIYISKLEYRDGEYYFEFGYDFVNSMNIIECVPGQGVRVEHIYDQDWNVVINNFRFWAHRLKKEIDAPDLWKEIEKYRATFSLVPPVELVNEPIPGYEVDQIASKVQLLTEKIEETFQLQEEQKVFVCSKLNYLADAAKRQGRLDWLHTFIGVFVTIAMALSLAPEQANKLWILVKEILGQFIRLIGPG